MELRGKTILLTGASSGIGLALSRQLANEKVNLALLARRENILRQLADELKDSGSVVLPVKCDVSNKDETARACREILARFGHIDIAILNSGLSRRAAAAGFRVDVAREIFDVNVFGILNFVAELIPDFINRQEERSSACPAWPIAAAFPRIGVTAPARRPPRLSWRA
jgi:NADP-dependent 3-hydroxy acid dehydrogenase YdfG